MRNEGLGVAGLGTVAVWVLGWEAGGGKWEVRSEK